MKVVHKKLECLFFHTRMDLSCFLIPRVSAVSQIVHRPVKNLLPLSQAHFSCCKYVK